MTTFPRSCYGEPLPLAMDAALSSFDLRSRIAIDARRRTARDEDKAYVAFRSWLEERLAPDDLAEADRHIQKVLEEQGDPAGAQDGALIRRRALEGAARRADAGRTSALGMFPGLSRIGGK